jgi:hypothetical protein
MLLTVILSLFRFTFYFWDCQTQNGYGCNELPEESTTSTSEVHDEAEQEASS